MFLLSKVIGMDFKTLKRTIHGLIDKEEGSFSPVYL